MAEIRDSGNRTTFDSGAVRDIQEGKGRADLLPLDVCLDMLNYEWDKCDFDKFVLEFIELFKTTGDYINLIKAAKLFSQEEFPDLYTALIEYSIHLEDGAKKYGDRNWQKGIPADRYVDSATRHYLKHMRGDRDERHDRACLWNLLCGAWTVKHMPTLNVYTYKEV